MRIIFNILKTPNAKCQWPIVQGVLPHEAVEAWDIEHSGGVVRGCMVRAWRNLHVVAEEWRVSLLRIFLVRLILPILITFRNLSILVNFDFNPGKLFVVSGVVVDQAPKVGRKIILVRLHLLLLILWRYFVI